MDELIRYILSQSGFAPVLGVSVVLGKGVMEFVEFSKHRILANAHHWLKVTYVILVCTAFTFAYYYFFAPDIPSNRIPAMLIFTFISSQACYRKETPKQNDDEI